MIEELKTKLKELKILNEILKECIKELENASQK